MCGNQSWMMDSHVWSRRKRGKKILSNERERILEIRTQTSWDELNFMANDYYPQFDSLFVCNYVHVRLVLFLFPSTVAGRESHKSFTFQSQWTSCLSKCKWTDVLYTSYIQVYSSHYEFAYSAKIHAGFQNHLQPFHVILLHVTCPVKAALFLSLVLLTNLSSFRRGKLVGFNWIQSLMESLQWLLCQVSIAWPSQTTQNSFGSFIFMWVSPY